MDEPWLTEEEARRVDIATAALRVELARLTKRLEAAEGMRTKLDKVATWLEMNAARDEAEASRTRFDSMREAFTADAKNGRATAKDIRIAIAAYDAAAKETA